MSSLSCSRAERQSRWESGYLRRLAAPPTLVDMFSAAYARRKPSPGQMGLFDEAKHPRAGKGTATGGQFTSGPQGGATQEQANTVPASDLLPGQQDLFGGASVPSSSPAPPPEPAQGEPPPPAKQQNLFHGIGSKDLAGQQDLFGDMDQGAAPEPEQDPREAAIADWKQNGVRSKAFKSFFGDWERDPSGSSKVVDENGQPQEQHEMSAVVNEEGKPVRVFHGTAAGSWHAFDKS